MNKFNVEHFAFPDYLPKQEQNLDHPERLGKTVWTDSFKLSDLQMCETTMISNPPPPAPQAGMGG